MKNKGYTIIEIISSLVIITLIGIISTMVVLKDKKSKDLSEIEKKIYNATSVYIDTNSEVKKQLYSNKNIIYTPLSVLQKEGLINLKDMHLDDDDYVITYLGNDKENDGCISAETFGSWTDTKKNKTIYICTNVNVNDLYTKLNDLSNRITELENDMNKLKNKDTTQSKKYEFRQLGGGKYTFTGTNPNNYVLFDVNSNHNSLAYFQNNLWRIVSINKDDTITLITSLPALSNNNLVYNTNRESDGYYKIIESSQCIGDKYYLYDSLDGWTGCEIDVSETMDGSKKQALYNSIIHKNYILQRNYLLYYYTSTFRESDLRIQEPKKSLFIGNLTQSQIEDSKNNDEFTSYLYNDKMLIGYGFLQWNEYYYNYILKEKSFEWDRHSKGNYGRYYLRTGKYYPVITLKSDVDLIENNECKNSGRKECPYKLQCTNC